MSDARAILVIAASTIFLMLSFASMGAKRDRYSKQNEEVAAAALEVGFEIQDLETSRAGSIGWVTGDCGLVEEFVFLTDHERAELTATVAEGPHRTVTMELPNSGTDPAKLEALNELICGTVTPAG